MQVFVDASPAEWLSHVEPLLLRAEAENNLLLGLAAQAVSDPARFGEGLTLARIVDGPTVVGAAMVNRYNLILSRLPDDALAQLAARLDDPNVTVPGVLGPDEVPERFVRHWSIRTGRTGALRQNMRIHDCRSVASITAAPGQFRDPQESEVPTLAEWRIAFHEATHSTVIEDDPVAAVRRMIERRDLVVWENDGRIVSCAATLRKTPHGAVIAFVYTPPEHRGRGYATSCVAELTRARLAAGAAFCCLYTDLANPTSNAIYARIGYRRVCDSAWWSVEQ
jgi:uncharacterized protein